MNRRHFMTGLAGLAACPLCLRSASAQHAHWRYQGENGPDHWGGVCNTGDQQSPIDLGPAIKNARPHKFERRWGGRAETMENNGHTIVVNMPAGSDMTFRDKSYQLKQFHFHRPSEHKVNGQAFAMEAHFVHAGISEAGSVGVIGVFLVPGRTNATFAKIIATMPQQSGPGVTADATIDPNQLLPREWGQAYWYEGSLTTPTPDCTQNVDWIVLENPMQVAAADIATFGNLYAMNARPIQNLNRRFILLDGYL